ncbi:hypothetical protein [Enterobacter roggenkampii]|uniref:hypothetical protein n=1 Tax=Enterobacter roggenkampii TaxID=1812935 RepID=UPI00399A17BC
MNRQIVYPGAIPLETDLLNTNKYSMLGLAKLASSLMGGNTYVHGLACTPSSPPSMVVNVAAGQIYSLQNIDGTAYSSLPADTTHSILKQGYVLDAQQFALTAPSTSGYSINYLIQATYADVDGGSTVLPYYNAANPSVAWSGPNNSGTAQYTIRQGVCTVSLKAGVAATTGTQVTPSPDSGCIGLYVITVAQGATTVTSANIATYANAPFLPQGGIVDGIQRSTMTYAADTGVANAYVVNINPGILTLSDGMVVNFKAANANTSSSTLNVCALGSFPVLNKFGQTLISGEIASGSHVTVKWSASASSWFILDSTNAVPTIPTASSGTNTTQAASTAFVQAAITDLILGPGAPAIGIPFFWPLSAMPNTVMPEWSNMVFLKFNGATFSAATYPKLALVFPGLVLTEARGEFLRIWDDGRGVDSGRALLSAQSDDFKTHEHRFFGSGGSAGSNNVFGITNNVNGIYTNALNQPSGGSSAAFQNPGGTETRPRNIAFNFLVRAK